jgi:hypothetical protein
MKVNYFDINIIDMQENAQVVSLEKTALGAPALIYNGADNLHQLIMTSELHFSFLVSELNSTKYKHLFTGSEVRYKVELIDDSVYNYPQTIWCGYLLPEQFNEPYKAKDYFIEFIATDGVALLKDKEFSVTIDVTSNTKISILDTINQCLLKTGLVLPIRFSEAIQSAIFELDYLQFETDILAYKEDTNYQDAFTVLENCLTFLGCKLFQFDGFWYVTGLNKQKETTVVYKQYEYIVGSGKLIYDKNVTVTKELITSPILEGASLALIPPYKTITTKWDADYQENLLPADVVTSGVDVNFLDYWQKFNTEPFLVSTYLKEYLLTDDAQNIYDDYKNGTISPPVTSFNIDDLVGGPFLSLKYDGVQSVYGGTVDMNTSILPNNYITLIKPFYVNGATDTKVKGNLKIDFKTIGYNLFLGTDTPETGTATVIGGQKYTPKSFYDSVKFQSVGHNLVTGDSISLEDSAAGDTFYTGVYEVRRLDADNFLINKRYDSNYIYTTNWVQITGFNTPEQAETELQNHFNKSGSFTSIDNTGTSPKIISNNHGLETSMSIRILTKEGYAKREYDGIHFVNVINGNEFTLLTDVKDVTYAADWEIAPFRANFLYSITKSKKPWIDNLLFDDLEFVAYNFVFDESLRGFYDYDISQNGVSVKGTVNLENIVLDANAWYNIRLHPVGVSDYLGNEIVYENLEFNLVDQQQRTETKTRNIDYTAALNLETFHNSSKQQNTNRNLYFSYALISNFSNGLIEFKQYDVAETLFTDDVALTKKNVILTAADYSLVQFGYKLYVYTAATETLAPMFAHTIVFENDGYSVYVDDEVVTPETVFIKINPADKVVLVYEGILNNDQLSEKFKEAFARVGVSEHQNWLNCLTMLHHDLYEKTAVRLSGEITDLVGPLDLVNLYYDQENKQCTPTNINLNLSEGVTQVTIVENQQNLVADYV